MFKKSSILRVFLGLPIVDQQAALLQQSLLKNFPAGGDALRWVKSGNYHVTVRFIGNMPEQKVSLLVEEIQRQIITTTKIKLNIIKLDHFPDQHSKIIAAYVEKTENLLQLHADVELAMGLMNVPPDRHVYNPHITLCRPLAEQQFRMNALACEDFHWLIDQLVLYQSIPEKKVGNHYVPLHRFKLQMID